MIYCSRRSFCAGLSSAIACATLSTSKAEEQIIVPNLETAKLQYDTLAETGPAGTYVEAIVWHPNGEWLATTTRGRTSVQLWDIKSKKSIWQLHTQAGVGSSSLAFSSNGKHLITSSAVASADSLNVGLSLINTESGLVQKNVARPEELKNAKFATSWALNKDGTRLAAGFFSVTPVPFAVYNTSDWSVAAVVDSPAVFPLGRPFAFEPISSMLATLTPSVMAGKPNTADRHVVRPAAIELWDIEANRLVKSIQRFPGFLRTYIPNSHLLVLVSTDLPSQDVPAMSNISIFDPLEEMVVRTVKLSGSIGNVAVSKNGSVFSAGSLEGRVTAWGMSSDYSSLEWSFATERKLEYVAGPVFNPASDVIAFAVGNQLCLSKI